MEQLTNINNAMSDSEIGYTDRIRLLREKLELTQEQFADKIGVSTVLISDIERKKKKLSLSNAIEIRRLFNVSLDWLYELSDDTNDTASNIIDDLRQVFNIDFKNRTISVDENLAEFLDKLFDAYKTKKEKNIPDDGFKYWVDGLKKDYNEKLKSPTGRITKKYKLQDYDEYKLEHAAYIDTHHGI